MIEILKQVIGEVKISATYKTDSMDICKYVKIKRVSYKDMSKSQLIKGVVSRKNLVNKKMRTNFNYPRVLMIESSLEVFNDLNETYN